MLTVFIIDDPDYILFVGDYAKEFKILILIVNIPVPRAFRDKDHVPGFDMVRFPVDVDYALTSKHVLFVLQRIGVLWHPPAEFHHEAPHGKVWSLLCGNEHLNGCLDSFCYRLRFDVTSMLHPHGSSNYERQIYSNLYFQSLPTFHLPDLYIPHEINREQLRIGGFFHNPFL